MALTVVTQPEVDDLLRSRQPLAGLDLRGLVIDSPHLAVDLTGSDLTGAVVNCMAKGTGLDGTVMRDARIIDFIVRGEHGVRSGRPVITHLDMSGVNAVAVMFNGVTMEHLDLTGASIGRLQTHDTHLVRPVTRDTTIRLLAANHHSRLVGDLTGVTLARLRVANSDLAWCGDLTTLFPPSAYQEQFTGTTVTHTPQGAGKPEVFPSDFEGDPSITLAHKSINAQQLRHPQLRGVNATEVAITATRLDVANLIEATLTGANVDGSHLQGCLLNRADLTDALFHNTTFTECDLTDVDITGAVFHRCVFRGMNLWEIGPSEGARFTKCTFVDCQQNWALNLTR